MSFSEKILLWYSANKRSLPWRDTRDPYRIWLSEIMLQQTRVAQGLPYYLKFTERFPTVELLASAEEEQILKLWQGLGYYSRARNLHATAKMVVDEYNGEFPRTYKELFKLKGVGDYTASAIASICFEKPQPVVDGNVFRVLARYFGVALPINSTEGIRYFKQLARDVMNTGQIRDYNQGIMEFGAIQCTPKNPKCSSCPLNESCAALQNGTVESLPVKLKKTKVRNRFFNYLVFIDQANKTLLEQRTEKGIWQNLWQFPLFESTKHVGQTAIEIHLKDAFQFAPSYELRLHNENVIVHKLSHQHLHTKFWMVKIDSNLKDGVALAALNKYPVPVLIADFIKTLKNSYF